VVTPSPTARETGFAGGGVTIPTPTPTASGATGPLTPDETERSLGTILVGGLLATGALALIGYLAILLDRRRQRRDARLAMLPDRARGMSAAVATGAAKRVEPGRPPTAWERDYALDDAPIGSVEYRPPPTTGDEGAG
jgi:hypothetical protein